MYAVVRGKYTELLLRESSGSVRYRDDGICVSKCNFFIGYMSKSLDEIRRKILERHQLEEIANPDRNKKINEKLSAGIKDIPVSKMLEQLLYLENDLLPRLEKKGGKESADYKFFEAMGKSLVWSVILCDRYDFLYRQFISNKVMLQLATENVALFARELEKYSTLEEIFFTDAMDRYKETVKSRVDGLKRVRK